ncbi:glycoside hydrolase family 10 protein [Carboxylicivirga taeanensis]|uniref:glycoside hydrolase family 10 protein n=1 Tax=Carboxylicivirga taeanensis TaxID=1416875 RepID=UPI003F6DB1A2
MNRKQLFNKLILLLICPFLMHCSGTRHLNDEVARNETNELPAVSREFRAAWIATVANINWPSKPGLTVQQQKDEAIALLDFLKANHFNAVIFQVRPQCDALYSSELEPWSYFLTGQQGERPSPYYDPLEFWIEEAHKRALEFHAWFNPYRAHHVSGGEVSNSSIVETNPELVTRLDNGYYWMIPTEKGTQDHSFNVVMDVVRRYNVDGVHFDDYFYPYPSYHNGKDFPDDLSWQKYLDGGGKLSRGDWRRDAVNQFMERIYKGIKNEKKHVKFGLSPFGVWRPNNPESIKGLDQYEVLYADAKLWLNKGWVDYWTPQLYWPINQMAQSFPVLVGWWNQQNLKKRHFWPGISPKAKNGSSEADEAFNQIMVTRGMLSESPGIVYWNINSLLKSSELVQTLKKGPYNKPALVPSSSWLGSKLPKMPDVELVEANDSILIKWKEADNTRVASWVVHYKYGSRWEYAIIGRHSQSLLLPSYKIKTAIKDDINSCTKVDELADLLCQVSVQVVDLFGNTSVPMLVTVNDLKLDFDALKVFAKEQQESKRSLVSPKEKKTVSLDLSLIMPIEAEEVTVISGATQQRIKIGESKVIQVDLLQSEDLELVFDPKTFKVNYEDVLDGSVYVVAAGDAHQKDEEL